MNPGDVYRESGSAGAAQRALRSGLRRIGQTLVRAAGALQKLECGQELRSVLEHNQCFRGCHSQRRAFVVADATFSDPAVLRRLRSEITLATGRAAAQTNFKATYLVDFASCDSRPELGSISFLAVATDRCNPLASLARPLAPTNMIAVSSRLELATEREIDLTQVLPRPPYDAQLCIMLALYMACSPIYIVGSDHGWLAKRLGTADGLLSVAKWSHEVTPYHQALVRVRDVWAFYERLKALAERRNTPIIDTSSSGFLDVFPRTTYEDIFGK